MITTTPAYTPAPETDRVVAVTPKGEAARILYRFLRAVRELDAADRAAILELLCAELPIS